MAWPDIPSNGSGVPYQDLAANANAFMTDQAMKPFIANLPQYATNVGQRATNTNQMLKGQLPDDVIRQISQQAAQRGIATGSPGSSNSNAAYLRALGLNSLQMMGQGSDQLSKSIADTPVPQLWNPLSLYVPQTLAAQELSAAQAGRTAGARTGGNLPSLTLPPPGNTMFGLNGPMGGQGPLSVSGPANGGPGAPLSTNDWWRTYGGQPANTQWEDTAFGNQGPAWQDTSWEDAAFGNYME